VPQRLLPLAGRVEHDLQPLNHRPLSHDVVQTLWAKFFIQPFLLTVSSPQGKWGWVVRGLGGFARRSSNDRLSHHDLRNACSRGVQTTRET